MDSTSKKWNGWKYELGDDGLGTLVFAKTGYWVPISTCTRSAQVLDWIAQVSHKTWATSDVLAGFVHAVDAVLNLQCNICPGGNDAHGHSND